MSEALPLPDWQRIEAFIGFGRADAPVVFIGMGEGLKSAQYLADDLAIRSSYESPIMDLMEAHRGIAGTDRYFDPERAPRQLTWRVMADLMLRRENRSRTPTSAERRRYRALRLGRSNGDTLLTELMPYPHPRVSDWLYAPYNRFERREDYLRSMLPFRIELLRSTIASARRELIICYGKTNWPEFKLLFESTAWEDIGPYCVSRIGHTRIVLTTHFSARGFNTDAQLASLAAVALG